MILIIVKFNRLNTRVGQEIKAIKAGIVARKMQGNCHFMRFIHTMADSIIKQMRLAIHLTEMA